MLAQRVAQRFVRAAYFDVGAIILYGKYKNHRGKVIAFGQDKWGNPTVEIEPIPKGRKQNKIMGLFKIWRADVKEKALENMEKQASKVVSRFVKAEGLPLGKTYERGELRFHRYMGSFRITELTNAGKRGKKVRQMSVGKSMTNDNDPWYDTFAKILPKIDTYNELKSLLNDAKETYPEIWFQEQELRGIDVNPGGTSKINLTTNEGLKITAEPLEFMVVNSVEFTGPKGNKFMQDTSYWSRSKKDAAPFYNWVKANLSEANKLDLKKFLKLCDDLNIKYDSH